MRNLPSTARHISAPDLQTMRTVIQKKTGLQFSTKKDRDLISRIGNEIDAAGDTNSFIEKLESHEHFTQKIVNKLTIGESYFFRNHPHFEALQNHIIPTLIKKNSASRHIKIWSAGCSTGEEPYSLAIMLKRDFPQLNDWNVEIIATDINTNFLNRAQVGEYSAWSFRGVDKKTQDTYFSKGTNNKFKINDDIKKAVSFNHLNLATLSESDLENYSNMDLILCRNVMIYFSTSLATQICQFFTTALRDQCHLILGHSESFPKLKNMETVYSNATYYYIKDITGKHSKSKPPATLVPGIGSNSISIPSSTISAHSVKKPAPVRQKPKHHHSRPQADDMENLFTQVQDLTIDGHLDKATTLLTEIKNRQKISDYRFFFFMALIADQKNETDDALKNLKHSIFVNKNFVIGHYYQAIIYERSDDKKNAIRALKNTCNLADKLTSNTQLPWGGGITAQRLLEIANERKKELEF